MRPIEILDYPDLINALAEYTAKYTKMLSEGAKGNNLVNYRETLQDLITEVNRRNRSGDPGRLASNKAR